MNQEELNNLVKLKIADLVIENATLQAELQRLHTELETIKKSLVESKMTTNDVAISDESRDRKRKEKAAT